MRKIRYKEAPETLTKMAAPDFENTIRSSVGMENFVGEYFFIEVDKLIPFKEQARLIFDEEELHNLASTIKQHGIRQPLTVIKSNIQDGKFEVVSGERRLRASKIAGLVSVPCIVINDRDSAEEIALIENIQRQDLHPVELSRSLKTLASRIGHGGQNQLAQKIGLSKSQISELLKITELSEDVQKSLLEHKVRGRELYRKLFSLTSESDQLNFIQSHDQVGLDGTKRKSKLSLNSSIIRIATSNDKIKIQKSGLSKLSSAQKQEVRDILLDVLKELV